MSIRIQRFDEHLKMPWKNGLGITREVISRPASDGSGGFDWRISLATVGASGPFSVFAGIDRTIAVLQGDGMQLTVDGRREPPLLVGSPPFAFSGDAEVQADCLGGETLDLNVMSRRGVVVHRMTKIDVRAAQRPSMSKDTVAIVFRGDATFTMDSVRSDVGLGDVLICEPMPFELTVTPVGLDCAFYAIEIASDLDMAAAPEQVAS
ncbi:HutD/Ves family protein [Rhizobium rosettiformans]|uniref:HutD/Ves family protein n=1 Tax=Rhizobium rosettiformans TaxID=1368430 RepID=UPI00285E505E|nr:HutD family protein [Rhizobium rosettiformans]MDR7027965.1 environmental stress-induced protein Ves [Rhizobium rosettiformans]MDR7064753.1 environmental stress-induced protein Ves [Rhizobium rosettiformans]